MLNGRNLRATLKKDQTHAVKIRKFCSGGVFETKPRMPTTSIVMVQTRAAINTICRRPNLSVRVIRQTEVKRAMIARQHRLVNFKLKGLRNNILRIVVIRNAFLNPLCLKNRLAYVLRKDNPVSC